MSDAQKPSKEIVGKGEYAFNVGMKAVASTVGAGLIAISLVCAFVVCALLWLLVTVGITHDYVLLLFILGVGGVLTCGARYVLRLGVRAIQEARQIDTGILLSHASTADLPASDSLVRASEEPLLVQRAVLLRAAVETQEWHSEQLLRAAGEGE